VNDKELKGRTALVTGSTDGIGVAVARSLAGAGARVVVTGRNLERGNQVVESIGAEGGEAVFIAADLGVGIESIRQLVDQATTDTVGGIDILVNNAALLIAPSPSAEVDQPLIDSAFAVSVRAAFLLTGMLAPAMAAAGGGAIVNMGSIVGLKGFGGSALYSATKATIHSLTKSWAAEYGPLGVRVNAVAPGPTWTEKNRAIADYLAPMIAAVPSRRASTLDEVADAVLFLASDRASNIHGAILSVDGGAAAV
jgi:NAD(P)-dependent dehydrogenase (short-subunit alcohol dehydrogenase family)